ncbi:glycosyltransferase [Bradyrhizobium betae]
MRQGVEWDLDAAIAARATDDTSFISRLRSSNMEINALRVGWIVSQPDKGDSDLFPDIPAHRREVFVWTPSRFAFCSDHTQVHAVHSAARRFGGFVVSGMSLAELESLYNLRALQLIDHEGRLDIPSIVIVRPSAAPDAFPRFGQRVRAGWPFRSLLFIADAATVELLRREGLVAMEPSEARRAGLSQLFAQNAGAFADTLADQVLAVQIQPPWPYGGSHTVFANQTDALLDRNWFVLRIIVDPEAGPGPTMRRRMKSRVAEANIDAMSHLDTVACSEATPHGRHIPNADELYRVTARSLMQTVIADDLTARLAARADIAVVNYAMYAGFALKTCPDAKLVLETHDDITRSSVTRSQVVANQPSFPTRASVKRHLRLERMIWRAADVCVALSLSELVKIQRYAPTVYVLPRPYARPSRAAGDDARWDILIVMNPHPFNIQGLDDFLGIVVAGNPLMAGLRIAIAGRVNEGLQSKWTDRLPNTHWLGYVEDLDSLRDGARLSVCPEQHGTGVAIKTLTAIAAGHPLVATSTALRGLPGAILDLIPLPTARRKCSVSSCNCWAMTICCGSAAAASRAHATFCGPPGIMIGRCPWQGARTRTSRPSERRFWQRFRPVLLHRTICGRAPNRNRFASVKAETTLPIWVAAGSTTRLADVGATGHQRPSAFRRPGFRPPAGWFCTSWRISAGPTSP